MEAPSGFEPLNEGFADPSLCHMGTAPSGTRDFTLRVLSLLGGPGGRNRTCPSAKPFVAVMGHDAVTPSGESAHKRHAPQPGNPAEIPRGHGHDLEPCVGAVEN